MSDNLKKLRKVAFEQIKIVAHCVMRNACCGKLPQCSSGDDSELECSIASDEKMLESLEFKQEVRLAPTRGPRGDRVQSKASIC